MMIAWRSLVIICLPSSLTVFIFFSLCCQKSHVWVLHYSSKNSTQRKITQTKSIFLLFNETDMFDNRALENSHRNDSNYDLNYFNCSCKLPAKWDWRSIEYTKGTTHSSTNSSTRRAMLTARYENADWMTTMTQVNFGVIPVRENVRASTSKSSKQLIFYSLAHKLPHKHSKMMTNSPRHRPLEEYIEQCALDFATHCTILITQTTENSSQSCKGSNRTIFQLEEGE